MQNEFVTVQHCGSSPEAYLAKQALESEGIDCIIRNENLHGLGQASQSIELQVALKNAERAKAILEPLRSGAKVHLDNGELISCPECGSKSTILIRKPPSKFFPRLFSIFIHDITRAKFRCSSCGNEFDVRW
jgi:DNA-directed RNA polymerase subunit RPC12/RpoP